MNQIVTIFRAEGQHSNSVLQLCSESDDSSIFGLRERFRGAVRDSDQFSGYVEFVDPGSMGDDFEHAMGTEAEVRYVSSGVVYWAVVTERLLKHANKNFKIKHQFYEQDRLAWCLNDLISTRFTPGEPAILVVFREILS